MSLVALIPAFHCYSLSYSFLEHRVPWYQLICPDHISASNSNLFEHLSHQTLEATSQLNSKLQYKYSGVCLCNFFDQWNQNEASHAHWIRDNDSVYVAFHVLCRRHIEWNSAYTHNSATERHVIHARVVPLAVASSHRSSAIAYVKYYVHTCDEGKNYQCFGGCLACMSHAILARIYTVFQPILLE